MSQDGPFNPPAPDAVSLLLSRRSGSAKTMGGVGPSKEQLEQILAVAGRAPDHGKLFPWRFIVFQGEGRERMGAILGDVVEAEGERPKQVEEERARFLRAPLVIGVISRVREQHKIPVWEQELSAGAVCQNILVAATAMGFVGNWVTEWYAYHPRVKERLGLKPGERVAGFIYIGSPTVALEERARPELKDIVSYF